MSNPAPSYSAQTLNLRCTRCAYGLRGLGPGGRCPECGTAIAESLEANQRRCGRVLRRARRLRGVPLVRSDRRWLRTISAALVALSIVQAALAAWYLAWAPSDMYRRSKAPDFQLFAIALGHAASIWLLTCRQRDAPAHDHAKHRPLRWSLRLLVLASPLAAGLGLMSELVRFQSHALWARLALAPALAMPMIVYLTFDWVACLAARLRGRRWVVVLRVIRLLATIFVGLMVAVGIASGQRVAEIIVAAFESLMALGGAGMACYAAIVVLMLWLAVKMWSAAQSREPRITAVPAAGATSDRPCQR